jgi:hypothetical protein
VCDPDTRPGAAGEEGTVQITASSISMTSAHSESSTRTFQERVRIQAPAPRTSAAPEPAATANPAALVAPALEDTADISPTGALAASTSSCSEDDGCLPTTEDELKLEMVSLLLEQITGKRFNWGKVKEFLARVGHLDAGNGLAASSEAHAKTADGTASAPLGFGLQYDSVETRSEQETMQYSAAGVVRTAEGAEIQFSVALSMSRSFASEQRVHFEVGDTRALQDPLVLNFGGSAASLSSTRFAFDVDSDGEAEQMPLLGAGQAFLARDANNNGTVDDGSELFGPATGSGFDELASLDVDGNGWIDEADATFAQLRLWTPEAEGSGSLATLAERGVGAISVNAVATPFALNDEANEALGQVKSTGVYLADDGTAGTVQQVDVTA